MTPQTDLQESNTFTPSSDLSITLDSLETLRAQLADIRKHIRDAEQQHATATQHTEAHWAELGDREVAFVVDGAPAPEDLRSKVQAAQAIMTMLTARLDGLKAREVKILTEIAEVKNSAREQLNVRLAAERAENDEAFALWLAEALESLRLVYSKAMGVRNDRVLASIRDAVLPVVTTQANGAVTRRNAFFSFQSARRDEGITTDAGRWSGPIQAVERELRGGE